MLFIKTGKLTEGFYRYTMCIHYGIKDLYVSHFIFYFNLFFSNDVILSWLKTWPCITVTGIRLHAFI